MEKFDAKQPNEEFFLEFDFENDFTNDDDEVYDSIATIDDVEVVDTADDSDVTSTMYDSTKDVISGTIAKIWIQAGTDGHKYKVTVRVSGALTGEIYELEGLIRVIEQ